jgi:hypothetical protein
MNSQTGKYIEWHTDSIAAKMGRRPARCYRYCKNKPYVDIYIVILSARWKIWIMASGLQIATKIGEREWRKRLAAGHA